MDVPSVPVARVLRVQPPGLAWGIAGYSEGGYCAANLALVYRLPVRALPACSADTSCRSKDQLGNPPRLDQPVRPGPAALRKQNTPSTALPALPGQRADPQFWLGVGGKDSRVCARRSSFQRLLLARQPSVQLDIEPGGGHTMATWRALVPPLLEWMTPRLVFAQLHPQLFHPRHARPHTGNVRPTPPAPSPGATPSPLVHRKHARSRRTRAARRQR